MKIAILYICTGNYDIFWDEFYTTTEKYFYPNAQKSYFVFTDSRKLLRNKNIKAYYQTKVGWPYDTLLRFNWFCSIQDVLLKYDYCYYINANGKFLRVVDDNLIPYPSKECPYVFSIHIRNYDDYEGATFTPERNPESTAYIAKGTPCRAHSGGFFGGTSKAFVLMSRELRERIAVDLQNGIIAIWHDQSHLIKFATEVSHYNVKKGVIASEEYADLEYAALIYRNKEKYGGNDKLRGASWHEKVKHFPRKIYRKLLKILGKFHLVVVKKVV